MNGTGDGKPQSNESMIKMVVFAVALDATVGVIVLGWCLLSGIKPDPTLLTAYVGLTGTLSGYLGGMLTKTTPTQSTIEKPTEPKPSGEIKVPEQKLETTT